MKMAEQNTCDTITKDKILKDQTDNVPPPRTNAFFAVKFDFHFQFHSFPVLSVGNDGFVPFCVRSDCFCPGRFCF